MTLLDANTRSGSSLIGEDTWELFEAVEQSFGIMLGDFHELAGIRVEDLANKICLLANYPSKEKCLSAVAFFRLRRAFAALFDVPVRSIRPTTPLQPLLPWGLRKEQWTLLQNELHLNFPGLFVPGWLVSFCLLSPLVTLTGIKIILGLALSWMVSIGLSLAATLVMLFVSTPLARAFPPSCETVGDLAKLVLAKNYAAFATEDCGSSKEDVLSALQLLIACQTGIEISKVSPATSIPEGLNIY